MLPTINKPTRITHTSATLIDNIYIKCNNYSELTSGIILSDISDHLPIFTFFGKQMTSPKTPLTFTCRPLDDENIYNIQCTLHENDWSSLDTLPINDAFEIFNKTLLMALDKFAPEKHVTIPYKNIIRDPWITPALLVSSNKRLRLYKKCINKEKSDKSFCKYVRYRNLFNKLKRQSKYQYYSELLNKYKDDIRKTWKVMNSINGSKNDKSSTSDIFYFRWKSRNKQCQNCQRLL